MLPINDSISLDTPVEFENYPTHTFYVDPITKQISGFADGLTAMKQAVEIIFAVERFKWQIFTPNAGIELDGLIGEDYGFVTSELKRRIEESLIPDNRILGASDFTFEQTSSDSIHCSLIINTVYGSFSTGVDINL